MTKEAQNKSRLNDVMAQKRVAILAHRGVVGSNIVDNTLESFEVALRQGADILEVDVSMTLDGDLFALHDGMEPRVLHQQKSIVEMPTAEVKALRYYNNNGIQIDHPINTLDEVFEHFKHRCLINLDRCWNCWQPVIDAIRRHGIEEQIILKSAPEPAHLQLLAEQAADIPFMPIIWTPEELEGCDGYKLNLVAVEFIGHREDAAIMQEAFVQGVRGRGLHCLISTLTLGNPVYRPEEECRRWRASGSRMADSLVNRNIYLAGGHDDDTAILGNPDKGWGWLVERGFNILQTDWTLMMADYLVKAGYNKNAN